MRIRVRKKVLSAALLLLGASLLLVLLLLHTRSRQSSSSSSDVGWMRTAPIAATPNQDPPAAELYSKVRLFCWILSGPNSTANSVAVWETWGQRCHKTVFVTTRPTSLFPAVVFPIADGRQHLTAKSMNAFNYTYQHYRDEYDWFLKADDDTFIIPENLRFFLAQFSRDDPVYYGHHFKKVLKQGYFSGGGGYVLSREALRRLVEDGINRDRCRHDGGSEDVEIGRCLEIVGVTTGDSRDYLGRERFHSLYLGNHLLGLFPSWYYQYAKHGTWKGVACCSELSISFHRMTPHLMYLVNFVVYHLRVYGVSDSPVDLNGPPPPHGQMRGFTDQSATSQPLR